MGEDIIPLDMQQEIIKRIDDVKTLLRCTSVSKTWNSFIKSPEFIADYHIHRQTHHLLVDCIKKIVSIDDDDTFPQNKLSLPLPHRAEPFSMHGSSLGLFCFILSVGNCYDYGDGIDYDDDDDIDRPIAVVWNPSIRKSIIVNYKVTPSYFYINYRERFGFGVSPHTNDPMLLKITYSRFLEVDDYDDVDYDEDLTLDSITSFPVEVYTLSSRVWTTLSISLPRKTIQVAFRQVVIDEFIYWIAYDKALVDNTFLDNRRLILSFDMKTQEFIEICLPKKLARPCYSDLCLSKLRESLVVVESNWDNNYMVWKMECGVPNSFANLYTIKIPNVSYFVQLRFRKSGGHIVLTNRKSSNDEDLFVFEPDSKHSYKIGIHGKLFYIDAYMETLLLLNQ